MRRIKKAQRKVGALIDTLIGLNSKHNTYHYNILANLVIKLFLTYDVITDKILLVLPVDKYFKPTIILYFYSKYVISRRRCKEVPCCLKTAAYATTFDCLWYGDIAQDQTISRLLFFEIYIIGPESESSVALLIS